MEETMTRETARGDAGGSPGFSADVGTNDTAAMDDAADTTGDANTTGSHTAATAPTTLALGVRAVDEARNAYDAFCKRVLAERQVAAYVLCDLLEELADEDRAFVARECIEGGPVIGAPLGRDSPPVPLATSQDGGGNRNEGVEPGVVDREVDQRAPGDDLASGGAGDDGIDDPHGCNAPRDRETNPSDLHGNLGLDPGPALPLEGEDTTMFEGTVRFDVRLRVRLPTAGASLEVNLEAQDDFHPGYPLVRRAIFYLSRMLSQQGAAVTPHSDYGALRKAVSVWVCTDPPRKHSNEVWRYHFAQAGPKSEEPYEKRGQRQGGAQAGPKAEEPYEKPVYDVAEAVLLCLGPKARGVDGAIGMLDALLAKDLSSEQKLAILGNKYGMMLEEPVMKEVRKMEDYWARLYNKGVADGKRIGRADGERIGIAKGAAAKLVENARNLAASLSAPVDTALDLLCASDEDRRAVHVALGE